MRQGIWISVRLILLDVTLRQCQAARFEPTNDRDCLTQFIVVFYFEKFEHCLLLIAASEIL